MIETITQIQIITCDKCGCKESASEEVAGLVFFEKGWVVNPRAKKYIHLCSNCQSKKQRKSHEFVKSKFY